MPDSRTHRGPDPRDASRFAPERHATLRAAVGELSWLLSRGYPEGAALKLVGDRYALDERQRNAVRRSSCGDGELTSRTARCVDPAGLRDQPLAIDGFNLITTVEAALGGAVVLLGRDGALRDLLGLHGTYRKVAETLPAIGLIAEALDAIGVGPCRWLLDRPVSNSGRLAGLIRDAAGARIWTVTLVDDPDPLLAVASDIVATADSAILDRGPRWTSLARAVVERSVPGARLVDLEGVSA